MKYLCPPMRVAGALLLLLPATTFGQQISATLLSVDIQPANVTLWGAKATQRFVILGKFSDGMERDLTAESRLFLSDGRFATVDDRGRVEAVADGRLTLRANVVGQTASTGIRIEGSQETRPFNFARDLGGILTRRDCNNSSCHGSVKGRSGFKLSWNASSSREDYKWIVEGGIYQVLTAESGGPKTPRINAQNPEKSLLLTKPTMTVPHGGGQRLTPDSADYQLILDWVRKGAPYGSDSDEIAVTQIDVFPRYVVLDRKGTRQLLVSAYLSNGRREDHTDRVSYSSDRPDVVQVSTSGLLQAVNAGEAVLTIRAVGHTVSARVGVIAAAVDNYPEIERRNFIDEHIFTKLRSLQIVPSQLAGDAEFLRRVCLDLTGTLPPPDRVREFLASHDLDKRKKLIDLLLASGEYIDFWTFRLSDVFRMGAAPTGNVPRASQAYWEWIRGSIAENKPYDQIARERIAAQGFDGPSRHYLPNEERADIQDIVAEEARVFLGRRLDCAQCHNHPYESWSQNQFWGMAAFFGRMSFTGWARVHDQVVFDDPAGHDPDYGEVGKSARVIHPRTKQEVAPAFLDGRLLPKEKMADPRKELARWMTAHPYFAEAAVNRVWGYLMGREIVDPVDDFRSSNPPTHPDLLDALAQDFREHSHDLKRLIRLIVTSRTYQLTSQPNETNKNDQLNYSRASVRRLDAEVLLDAISDVTEVPEVFDYETGGGRIPPKTRAINVKEPDRLPSVFLEVYGRPLRVTVPEREGKPTLDQALHMLVGTAYTEKLLKEGGRIDRLAKSGASDREVVEELYMATLCRVPTEDQLAELTSRIEPMSGRYSRRMALANLLWALISSREFASNH